MFKNIDSPVYPIVKNILGDPTQKFVFQDVELFLKVSVSAFSSINHQILLGLYGMRDFPT